MPQPSSIVDAAVRDVVVRVLAGYPADVAAVQHAWGEQAGMWFTEVRPHRSGAASLSLSFDGHDLLNLNVDPTWFEVFPFTGDEESLARVESIVRAVMAGHVEEGGSRWASFARIHTDRSTSHAHAHALALATPACAEVRVVRRGPLNAGGYRYRFRARR